MLQSVVCTININSVVNVSRDAAGARCMHLSTINTIDKSASRYGRRLLYLTVFLLVFSYLFRAATCMGIVSVSCISIAIALVTTFVE